MSVTQTHYVVLGWRLSEQLTRNWYDDELSSSFEEHHDNPRDLRTGPPHRVVIIDDGMNGEFVVVGRVIGKGNSVCGLPFTSYRLTNEETELLAKDAAQTLPSLARFLKPEQVAFHAFTLFY